METEFINLQVWCNISVERSEGKGYGFFVYLVFSPGPISTHLPVFSTDSDTPYGLLATVQSSSGKGSRGVLHRRTGTEYGPARGENETHEDRVTGPR